MTKSIICFLVAVISQNSWSQNQERSIINGKITSNTNDLEGVYVVNAKTEVMTTTDASGTFSILAKPDDVLVVHLVVVGNVGASEVKKWAESLYRQVSKSRGKLDGRDSLFFLQ